MKKSLHILLAGALLLGALTGCGSGADGSATGSAGTQASGNETQRTAGSLSGPITVVSREDGSGTRGAFIELTGVQQKDGNGNKTDRTTEEAVIANATDVVLTNVAGDPNAIGYISLGSLNDTVKALQVDGVDATSENVKNGTYTLSRPFQIATKGEPAGVAADFIHFILSKEGQAVVSGSYIPVNDAAEDFASNGASGAIKIGGSSSVAPIMEKLTEAYIAVNPNAQIDLQTSDSTAGMTGAMDGTFDIGMASRDLSETESASLTAQAIALDGIAMIVSPSNPVTGLTSEQIKSIYTGDTADWSALAS